MTVSLHLQTQSNPFQPIDLAVPSLHELEAQVASAIKAKDDFTHSRLPSSLSHYGYWLLAGASGTASAVLTGASAALGVKLAEDIYESTICGDYPGAYIPLEAIVGTVVVGASLAPALGLARLCGHAVQKISDDNAVIERALQHDIDDACQRLAEVARALSPVEFEQLLKRGVVPWPSLIEACGEDVDKASLLADHLLGARQLAPLRRLADQGLWHCIAVGDVLLNALKAPEAFIALLETHPDGAADVLAVLCMAANAMTESASPQLEAYLQDHPAVARKALRLLKARAEDVGLHNLPGQIEQGRLAGVAMQIARHGSTD